MSRRTALWAGAIVALLVLANLAAIVGQKRGRADASADHSTYRNGPRGMGLAYAVLGRLGMDVRRLQRRLTEMPSDCTQLWLITPTEPLTYEELDAVRGWVASGGTLVCSLDFMAWAITFGRWQHAAPGDQANPFPELGELQPRQDIVQTLVGPAGSGPYMRPAVGYAVPPLREGVFDSVPVLATPSHTAFAETGGWVVLAREGAAPLVAGRRIEKGYVLALADPDIVSNRGLVLASNAVFVANVAGRARGAIYFDEQHHGFGEEARSFVALVGRSRAALPAGLAVVGLALVVIALGARLGEPSEPYQPARRSALEYVYSVSWLYRQAGARGVALASLRSATVRRLGGGSRLSERADHAQLAQIASARTGTPAAEVKRVLDAAAQATDRGVGSDSELLLLAKGLAGINEARREPRIRQRKSQGRTDGGASTGSARREGGAT